MFLLVISSEAVPEQTTAKDVCENIFSILLVFNFKYWFDVSNFLLEKLIFL